jgi:hypothetical protein
MFQARKLLQGALASLMLIFSLFFSSCSNQVISGSGGYSDVALNRNSSEYDIKRLKEVEVIGNSFWGIPYMKNKESKNKSGFIFRFNGVSMFRTPSILPVMTLLSTSIFLGQALEPVFGYKKETFGTGNYAYTIENLDKPNLHWAIISVLTLPITGAINNQVYSNIAVSNAMHEMNYQLVLTSFRIRSTTFIIKRVFGKRKQMLRPMFWALAFVLNALWFLNLNFRAA